MSLPHQPALFKVAFARDLNPNVERAPIQQATAMHVEQFFGSLGFEPQRLAAAFQREIRRCRASGKPDKSLEQQYLKILCSLTPIHHLPVEILDEILLVALNCGTQPAVLMLICQKWHDVVWRLTSAKIHLGIGTLTAPEGVEEALRRAGERSLDVVLDTNTETETETETDKESRGVPISPYTGLTRAAASALKWTRLAILSLPTREQIANWDLGNLHPMTLPEMPRLQSLKIASVSRPSPVLDWLLHGVGTSETHNLAFLECHSPCALHYLVQPTYASTFGSLTTFKAHVPKMSEPIDLLPHFSKLEVLDISHVLLPLYHADSDLPFVQTLRRLSIKGTSIGWMEGRTFSRVETCSINTPPWHHSIILDVFLPVCKTFHFESRSMLLLKRFQVPVIDTLMAKSDQWRPRMGNVEVIYVAQAGLGTLMRPRALHLSILCKESALIQALKLLPDLREPTLEMRSPSALSRDFFGMLLAKPVTDPIDGVERDWVTWVRKEKGWRPAILPYLTTLELKFRQWFRQSDRIDALPMFLALVQSRKKAAIPLKSFSLSFSTANGGWISTGPILPTPHVRFLGSLDVPHLQNLGQPGQQEFEVLLEACLTSTTLYTMDLLVPRRLHPVTELLLGSCFSQLRILKLEGHSQIFSELPSLREIEELSLVNVDLPPHTQHVDLPLVRTLRRLRLNESPLQWLTGRVFSRLERFRFGRLRHDMSEWMMYFPVCTHIIFEGDALDELRFLRSHCDIPLLNKIEL